MERSSDDSDNPDSRSADAVDIHVGMRVRLRRMTLGMSQEMLASQVGLTFQQIQKYEKGTNRISASRLYQFSNALGVSIQFFYDDMPSKMRRDDSVAPEREERDVRLSEFLTSKDGIEASLALSKISDKEVLRSLIALMEVLVRRV